MAPDEELKTLIRDFKSSVSADIANQHQRIDELADEVRVRITTAETAIINEIRALANRFDLRLSRMESRLDALER